VVENTEDKEPHGIRYVAVYSDQLADQDDDIDLKELVAVFLKNRKLVFRFTAFFFLFGIIYAIISPVEYEAETRLMPEYAREDGGISIIQSLGGLFGLGEISTYAGSSDAIRVELYPDITASLPVLFNILDARVYSTKHKTTTTLRNYFLQHRSGVFKGYINELSDSFPRISGFLTPQSREWDELFTELNHTIQYLTVDDYYLIDELRSRIKTSLDNKSGLLTITVRMPEPLISATVAALVLQLLTEYVVDYRLEKLLLEKQFLLERMLASREKYYSIQYELAEMKDSNMNISSARALSEIERLQNEYNGAYDLYSVLLLQLEQVRIKVQEETPVFKVLDPVIIPIEKASPRVFLILITFTIFGFIIAVIVIFGKSVLYSERNQLTNHS